MKYIILVLAFLAMSCNKQAGNTHGHNPNGSHIGDETPRLDYTIWTDKTELFVEFPALIVGETSRFAAHFTVLDNHQPVRNGSVTVSLIKNAKGIRSTVDTPSSPGIFSLVIKPKEAGTYQLVFELKTDKYTDKIIVKEVIVFENYQEAISVLRVSEEDRNISFLKEQAWKIEFQTKPVVKGEIYNVINSAGVWEPSVSSEKNLIAKSNGMIEFTSRNLTKGTQVKRGQLLMSVNSNGLASNNLNAEIKIAKIKFEQVKLEFNRKKQLYESKIIPKSEFEKVDSNYNIAKLNYQTLSEEVSGGSKQIRALSDGFIKAIFVSNGDYVDQGASLLSIVSNNSKVLKTQIAPNYGLTMKNVKGIWFETNKGNWVNVFDNNGMILSIGKNVAREDPLISVFAKVNPKNDMLIGSLTQVQIAMGDANESLIIPVNALLEDYGSYSVMVQHSGESFERKPISIGKRNGENVEILTGLKLGEVVVTKGAFQVKMASMSGTTPAHGHEH